MKIVKKKVRQTHSSEEETVKCILVFFKIICATKDSFEICQKMEEEDAKICKLLQILVQSTWYNTEKKQQVLDIFTDLNTSLWECFNFHDLFNQIKTDTKDPCVFSQQFKLWEDVLQKGESSCDQLSKLTAEARETQFLLLIKHSLFSKDFSSLDSMATYCFSHISKGKSQFHYLKKYFC